jgi:hypothetical protein
MDRKNEPLKSSGGHENLVAFLLAISITSSKRLSFRSLFLINFTTRRIRITARKIQVNIERIKYIHNYEVEKKIPTVGTDS